MYTIIYYSPTGNTKYLANELSTKLKCPIYSFDDKEIGYHEHLIIMGSINAFNMSNNIVKNLKNISKVKRVSIISVGCNKSWINNCASYDLVRYFKKKNKEIIINEVLAMPLTLVYKMNYKDGNKLLNNALSDINIISEKIKKEELNTRKYKFSAYILSRIGKLERVFARLFGKELYVNKNCIKCKKCINVCPSKNIYMKNKKIKFKFKCTMCLSCIYNCPKKAINPRISKFIRFKDGYNIKEYVDK